MCFDCQLCCDMFSQSFACGMFCGGNCHCCLLFVLASRQKFCFHGKSCGPGHCCILHSTIFRLHCLQSALELVFLRRRSGIWCWQHFALDCVGPVALLMYVVRAFAIQPSAAFLPDHFCCLLQLLVSRITFSNLGLSTSIGSLFICLLLLYQSFGVCRQRPNSA